VNKKPQFSLILAFALGACVSSFAHQAPSNNASASDSQATVIHLTDAKKVGVPSGKAFLTHLAKGKNAFLGRLQMAANGSVPLHQDATEEYIHILEGSGTMTIEGQEYEVQAGSTIYMPAKAKVSFKNGPEELVAIQVFAGPAPASKYDAWDVINP
jgi:quercetin dioxygenase-like cupin family protein